MTKDNEPTEEIPVPCPTCEGRGFKEYEAGLIQVQCADCGGTGKAAVSGQGRLEAAITKVRDWTTET